MRALRGLLIATWRTCAGSVQPEGMKEGVILRLLKACLTSGVFWPEKTSKESETGVLARISKSILLLQPFCRLRTCSQEQPRDLTVKSLAFSSQQVPMAVVSDPFWPPSVSVMQETLPAMKPSDH